MVPERPALSLYLNVLSDKFRRHFSRHSLALESGTTAMIRDALRNTRRVRNPLLLGPFSRPATYGLSCQPYSAGAAADFGVLA
jgi:hypothetical protein